MTERITEELREWITDNDLYARQIAGLRSIADRIDAAHERSYREQIDSAANAAWESLDNASDEVAAEHGFVRLPVDADGNALLPGSAVENANGDRLKVDHIDLYNYGLWSIEASVHCTSYHFRPDELRRVMTRTPAERIREIAKALDDYLDSQSPLEGPIDNETPDKLYAIAEELDEPEVVTRG